MSLKESLQSQRSLEELVTSYDLVHQFAQAYPEEVGLWTRRVFKDILSTVRDIVVFGVPGFVISRLVEFLEWRETYVKNPTFAGAVWYVNHFSKEE
jgi:hypothetical protein